MDVKKQQLTKSLLAVLFLSLMVVGCASAPKFQPTGFLSDYSSMVESNIYKGLYVDKRQDKHIGQYSKFLIDPIKVYFHEDAKGSEIDPEDLQELTELFYDETVAALEENYTVVDEPGPGVLLIRAAITDFIPNKVLLNLHWTTTASKKGIGGAAVEAEFVDSVSGERIMAIVDQRKGKSFEANIVKSYTRGFSKWGHARGVIKAWPKMLTKRLDELHAMEANRN